MTEVLLLCVAIFGTSIQSVLRKIYNNKNCGGVFIFNSLTVLAAGLFFLFTAEMPLSFTAEMVPYSVGFALAYATASIFSMLAILEGALSLSSLAISFSLLIPTLWGLFFYGDDASIWFFIGFGLLLISLVLINNTQGGGVKITFKWVLYAVLAFLGNGICSTVQTGYAKDFKNAGKSEFMILALGVVFLIMLAIAIFTDRRGIPRALGGGWYLMVICGLANGAVNLSVILLTQTMPTSLMFPLISAGGIVLTSLVSIFIYKEKLSLLQYIGMLLGIGAIVFMSI